MDAKQKLIFAFVLSVAVFVLWVVSTFTNTESASERDSISVSYVATTTTIPQTNSWPDAPVDTWGLILISTPIVIMLVTTLAFRGI